MNDSDDIGRSADRTNRASGDDPNETDVALRRVLLYGMLPFWIVPGLADWYWHKRSHIETTAGTHESLTHALMMSSIGIPLMMALLCEIDALVLTTMIAGTLVHEVITYWDVDYAKSRREVATIEQHTHSFLEMLPFASTLMACCLKAPQAASIFGRGSQTPDWTLKRKRPPLTARYVAGLLACVTAGIVIPYAEEFVRCWRVDGTLAPHAEAP